MSISRLCSLYSTEQMQIGDHVRIDDFSILSGQVMIGSNVHIAAYCALFGTSGIKLDDFSGLSSRVTIYSVSDDYSGESLTNPTVPVKYRKLDSRPVIVGRHCIIGSGAVILPGATLGEGVAVGAMSLVTQDLEPWNIYSGIPAKRIKKRSRALLRLENEYLNCLR
ncbi:MAG: acyltransferase [Methylococcales bacterium]